MFGTRRTKSVALAAAAATLTVVGASSSASVATTPATVAPPAAAPQAAQLDSLTGVTLEAIEPHYVDASRTEIDAVTVRVSADSALRPEWVPTVTVDAELPATFTCPAFDPASHESVCRIDASAPGRPPYAAGVTSVHVVVTA